MLKLALKLGELLSFKENKVEQGKGLSVKLKTVESFQKGKKNSLKEKYVYYKNNYNEQYRQNTLRSSSMCNFYNSY